MCSLWYTSVLLICLSGKFISCSYSSNHFKFPILSFKNVERKSLFNIFANNTLNLINILTEKLLNSSESISSINFMK